MNVIIEDIMCMEKLIRIANDYLDDDYPNTTWVFRGLKNSKYELKSSFDRSVEDFENIEHTQKKSRSEIENDMIKKFIRQGQNYTDHKINFNDWFAFEDAEKPERDRGLEDIKAPEKRLQDKDIEDPVVYALESCELNKKVKETLLTNNKKHICDLLKAQDKYTRDKYQFAFKELIKNTNKASYAYAVNPYFLNRRLTIQQGVFLFQGDISKSFEKNIENININIIKYRINYKLKKDILCMLNRMNINSVTLFPGLDGFTRSLKNIHSINYQT